MLSGNKLSWIIGAGKIKPDAFQHDIDQVLSLPGLQQPAEESASYRIEIDLNGIYYAADVFFTNDGPQARIPDVLFRESGTAIFYLVYIKGGRQTIASADLTINERGKCAKEGFGEQKQ